MGDESLLRSDSDCRVLPSDYADELIGRSQLVDLF